MDDVKATLSKIPKSHFHLVKQYKFHIQDGNTLNNDKKHVGEIDEKNKKITVAAPWNYGREFTILHEVAHAVWKYKMTPDLKKEWEQLIKKTKKEMMEKNKENKDSIDQNPEELFSMAYANTYAKHKNETYAHDAWNNFIKAVPQ